MATRALMTDLEELDESECWDLLAHVTVGRLGLHFGAIPRIVPMHFTLFDKCIVVCTAVGAAVTHALRDSVVAFQVDDFHLNNQEAWSVVAVGPCTRMTDLRRLNAVDGLPTDPTTRDRHWVTQIEPRLISGRRFVQGTSTMSIPKAGV
jgi:nitroimidazol reductase NimA-like FMN-containing flavoprotein (pyridoxamine 5'-phosphate oxidase superfamily)